MQSSNPILTRGAYTKDGYATFDVENLEQTYQAPSAGPLQTGRMTIDDVVTRTAMLIAIVIGTAAITWSLDLGGGIFLIALIGGLVLSFVNALSKTVRPPLIIAYAVAQGIVVGALSNMYNSMYDGIVTQAVVGTMAAFVGVLALYASGRLRATPKFTRTLIGAAIGYFVLAMASLIASFFGVGNGWGFYGVSGIGLLIAGAGVLLASLFLVLDFDQIENGVRSGAPQIESWRAGFGLLVTMVWLYMEILRFLAILRNND